MTATMRADPNMKTPTSTRRFWDYTTAPDGKRVLELRGPIAPESWFGDETTPQQFRDELMSGSGDIIVWINSPGGDVIAAAEIYSMLMDYPGHVTVKIDGLAASAASVIAMAGSEVLMSPVAMLMIHNPMTAAIGDSDEMLRAVSMLAEVKESILNAYELKTDMDRTELSELMDAETWMDANKAIELGFADGLISPGSPFPASQPDAGRSAMVFSRRAVTNSLINAINADLTGGQEPLPLVAEPDPPPPAGRAVSDLLSALDHLKP
ncbi:peptidase [Boudabousia liubingyangii]|uniref:head maturation protease, ClpP-related n=1 Tax=Boudabousia liubingyangii TaxID=1921764 RepID=UPI00093CC2FB|nr:peptidase [Boudabousia liubingyangii]